MNEIAIVGGTGDLGMGLAARLAKKHGVIIGSRDAARARQAADAVSTLSGASVAADTNERAVGDCSVAILAIPDLPSDAVLLSLKPMLAGKLVISPIVSMTFRDGSFLPGMQSGSAAERVAASLGTRVAAAFHNVPAARLLDVRRGLDYDVLVTADDRAVYDETAAVVSSIEGLRPLYAGPLRNSGMVESITPLLLNLGKLNKLRTPSVKIV